jgi:hypothetical protein
LDGLALENLAKQLIKYFKTLGIQVYTNTKARGHQGFYVKNRIDISKNTKEERIIPTLLHEFAHFIHEKLEKGMAKTGGTLEVLFCATHIALIEKELMAVTNFVDENSLCKRLTQHKQQLKDKIKKQESIIKLYYPKFMRSKKFKEFDKFIRKSKAKHLLSYDRVKFVSRFLRHIEILSIDNLEIDFPEMPTAYCAYIRLKSLQRKQARNSRRINHLNKYYSKPTELFARLVEGLYLDNEKTQQLAPLACERFSELIEKGYYFELQEVFQLIYGFKIETTEFSTKYLLAQS